MEDCQGREEEDEDYCCNEGGIVVVEDEICVFERHFGLFLEEIEEKMYIISRMKEGKENWS